jgi:hypothetical protein
VSDATKITLPYIPDTVVTVEDMLGKVPKLRYFDHDVRYATKFLGLEEETYLEDMGEIGCLGRPIMEPAQWITSLYNYGIVNLLDIPHFKCGKNVGLCVKQLLARVHGGILWIHRKIHINVALISNITGLNTIGAQLEEYLENKAREKEIAEIVKAQFGKNRGSRGIVLKEINDAMMQLSNKLMAYKLLRKCRKEEAPT